MKRFIDNGDDTVTDLQTSLVWTKSTAAKDVDHKTAEQKIAELGNGWRLPTSAELFSIADHSKHSPAIDTEAFPDTESDWYWTSTPCAWSDSAVWVVGFGYGGLTYGHRGSYACVRAVRSSQ